MMGLIKRLEKQRVNRSVRVGKGGVITGNLAEAPRRRRHQLVYLIAFFAMKLATSTLFAVLGFDAFSIRTRILIVVNLAV